MNWKKQIVLAGLGMHAASAYCINGADMTGYGTASLAMGGTSIANPQDTLVGSSNPAGMAFLGNLIDIDAALFAGNSSATYLLPSNAIRQSIMTVVPNFGVHYRFSPQWTFGISASAGGAGVNYDTAAFPIEDAPHAESSLGWARLVHSLTYQPVDNFALGVGLVLGYQRFESNGSILPGPTGSPVLLPSHGLSQALGLGASVGVMWKVSELLSLGAQYQSKTHMGRLQGYKDDLLSSIDGHIDLPESFGIGVALHPLPKLTLAADWEQIRWGRSGGFATLFGWKNQNVFRAGASYDMTPSLTMRAGISHASEVVPSDAVARNVYTPGINTLALTVGAAYNWRGIGKLSFAYEYDPRKTLIGTGVSTGSSISGHVQAFVVGYQRKF
ncbi:OmpP1/FadL family transporter [Paraburkholderia sp. MM5384-R2]|uniref:OmpP1/FadL family transporter n=1 Tax=Paraburkholderia sp. MM5384-R2 TaxID=2723097 RepID=UPI00161C759A|nr:outer membrane protein transport protein [Paraburkholderia sp. MM5384-R2]MBB5499398.1 long-chain fatty acid transport protein [Paraburkholderia sp. MM5384-R2]